MKYSTYSIATGALCIALNLPQNSYSKDTSQSWAGTYVLKGGGGGLTIENEGKKLWIEIWRDYKDGEERRPGQEKEELVYFASIHGRSAKRLPSRGDVCPQTFTLTAQGVKLIDECQFSPIIYYFERVK